LSTHAAPQSEFALLLSHIPADLRLTEADIFSVAQTAINLTRISAMQRPIQASTATRFL
jgi:hypothetical protein